MERIRIEITKRGLNALWESGGGYSNTGEATIICGKDGEPKTPIYIRQSGSLACSNHALIPVEAGDIIILASHHREDFEIEVYEIMDFYQEGESRYASLRKLGEFSQGEWDNVEIAEKFSPAIKEARAKAMCYHCRQPHFINGQVCHYSSLNEMKAHE